MLKGAIDWIIRLFDRRSDYEKREDERLVNRIKSMHQRGYTIHVGERGGCKLVKLDASED